MQNFNYKPIGYFECDLTYKYEASRQSIENTSEQVGKIVLVKGFDFEQALMGIDGFKRLWIIYEFHKNKNWKPMTETPRATQKQGVFATRAPYRPNPIGLSCVEFIEFKKNELVIRSFDLLDETPILDIKPYIPSSDAFDVVNKSWIEEEDLKIVEISDQARSQILWLQNEGVKNLEAFVIDQLKRDPINGKKKRIKNIKLNAYELSFRTWRVQFDFFENQNKCLIEKIYSGYSVEDLCLIEDPYKDKSTHIKYIKTFA